MDEMTPDQTILLLEKLRKRMMGFRNDIVAGVLLIPNDCSVRACFMPVQSITGQLEAKPIWSKEPTIPMGSRVAFGNNIHDVLKYYYPFDLEVYLS